MAHLSPCSPMRSPDSRPRQAGNLSTDFIASPRHAHCSTPERFYSKYVLASVNRVGDVDKLIRELRLEQSRSPHKAIEFEDDHEEVADMRMALRRERSSHASTREALQECEEKLQRLTAMSALVRLEQHRRLEAKTRELQELEETLRQKEWQMDETQAQLDKTKAQLRGTEELLKNLILSQGGGGVEKQQPQGSSTPSAARTDSPSQGSSPQSRIAESFNCPITCELMQDPVVAADGFTYERWAIEKWLKHHDTSPCTGCSLPHKQLIPNFLIRSQIRNASALFGLATLVATEPPPPTRKEQLTSVRRNVGRRKRLHRPECVIS
eukprot:GILK01018529.1.p1 GENE.GILK01018529.1~~GILK01018529.1.p1  ORF type:complete len:347 (+),score=48.33 GILK01018529.1:72-1043(+)